MLGGVRKKMKNFGSALKKIVYFKREKKASVCNLVWTQSTVKPSQNDLQIDREQKLTRKHILVQSYFFHTHITLLLLLRYNTSTNHIKFNWNSENFESLDWLDLHYFILPFELSRALWTIFFIVVMRCNFSNWNKNPVWMKHFAREIFDSGGCALRVNWRIFRAFLIKRAVKIVFPSSSHSHRISHCDSWTREWK